MDTTTVNYGLNKMSSILDSSISKMSDMWIKVAPTIENVTDEYVKFVVMKEVLYPVCSLILIAIFVFVAIECFTTTKDIEDITPSDVAKLIIGGVSCLISVISLIMFLCTFYSAILAFTCPEMFTIHQLIGK